MESPTPGGGDGVQQQMVKQQEPAQQISEEEPLEPEAPLEEMKEEVNTEAEIVHEAPVSKFAELVLKQKPKPPVRQTQLVKKAKAAPSPMVKNERPIQTALETLKGREQGQVANGAKQMAGIQQAGLAGEVKAARYVMGSARNPKPKYPKLARQRGWQGRVVLSVHISEEGTPVDVQVKQSSGYGILDRAALKALKKWIFQPAQKNGIRMSSHLNIPIRFDLRNS